VGQARLNILRSRAGKIIEPTLLAHAVLALFLGDLFVFAERFNATSEKTHDIAPEFHQQAPSEVKSALFADSAGLDERKVLPLRLARRRFLRCYERFAGQFGPALCVAGRYCSGQMIDLCLEKGIGDQRYAEGLHRVASTQIEGLLHFIFKGFDSGGGESKLRHEWRPGVYEVESVNRMSEQIENILQNCQSARGSCLECCAADV
jgi:hypothetical protein